MGTLSSYVDTQKVQLVKKIQWFWVVENDTTRLYSWIQMDPVHPGKILDLVFFLFYNLLVWSLTLLRYSSGTNQMTSWRKKVTSHVNFHSVIHDPLLSSFILFHSDYNTEERIPTPPRKIKPIPRNRRTNPHHPTVDKVIQHYMPLSVLKSLYHLSFLTSWGSYCVINWLINWHWSNWREIFTISHFAGTSLSSIY
jgi:hypothetical protein